MQKILNVQKVQKKLSGASYQYKKAKQYKTGKVQNRKVQKFIKRKKCKKMQKVQKQLFIHKMSKNAKMQKYKKNSSAPAISTKKQNNIKQVKYKIEKYKNS